MSGPPKNRDVKLQVIWGECIAGALYINDFEQLAKEAGFEDPRILHTGPVAVKDAQIQVDQERQISQGLFLTDAGHCVVEDVRQATIDFLVAKRRMP